MVGHWYSAYGLRIHSQLPLPSPINAPSRMADVEIRIGTIPGEMPEQPVSRSVLRATPDEICCNFPGAGRFSVRAGREVIIEPADGVNAEMLIAWVQGTVLSLLLHQRGYLVLHASSVAINGHAVAFIGESGWGKSTSAAALHARGHRLIADDIVAVRFDSGIPMVVPGFHHVKLMPEAATFLGHDANALPNAYGDDDKRLHFARERFSPEPVPLSHVFVLGEAPRCIIEPLKPQLAMLELVKHAFVAQRTEFLRQTQSAASHFSHCTQLTRATGVFALRRPKIFDQLPMMMEMIERHVADMSVAAQGS